MLRTGEKRNVYRYLVGKAGGKKPVARPRRRWEYNIKMDLGAIGWDGMNLDRDRNQWRVYCEHGSESLGSFKYLGAPGF
jgi:hypothetical protein